MFTNFRVCRNAPIGPKADLLVKKAKFFGRSNSTLLDHCNLPALFNTHETPIVPTEIMKKRQSIGEAQLKKSKLSINFDNPLLDKTPASDEEDEEDDDEEEVAEVLTPNVSQKKKRKRVRKRKAKVNGSQASTPKVDMSNGHGDGGGKNQSNGQENGKKISKNQHKT